MMKYHRALQGGSICVPCAISQFSASSVLLRQLLRHKFLSVSALALPSTDHQFVRTDITTIIHMHALRTDTMAHNGFPAEFSLGQDPGFEKAMDASGAAMAMDGVTMAAGVIVADMVIAARDGTVAAGSMREHGSKAMEDSEESAAGLAVSMAYFTAATEDFAANVANSDRIAHSGGCQFHLAAAFLRLAICIANMRTETASILWSDSSPIATVKEFLRVRIRI